MHIQIYRLFNEDIKHFNPSQLLLHWKKYGSQQNRIYSFESFFERYPYYDDASYKLYNPELIHKTKLELMFHWHMIGINQHKICSDAHFNLLYPHFTIDLHHTNSTDIYTLKNNYHNLHINHSSHTNCLNHSFSSINITIVFIFPTIDILQYISLYIHWNIICITNHVEIITFSKNYSSIQIIEMNPFPIRYTYTLKKKLLLTISTEWIFFIHSIHPNIEQYISTILLLDKKYDFYFFETNILHNDYIVHQKNRFVKYFDMNTLMKQKYRIIYLHENKNQIIYNDLLEKNKLDEKTKDIIEKYE